MTLGFVLVTHLIGFNNVRVLEIFWIPELALIVYAISTLIPFEHVPRLFVKFKNFVHEKRKQKKVVKFKSAKRNALSLSLKKLSLPMIFDGLLIAAVACLSFYLLYRI
jgi:hypothetical protein